MALTTPPSNAAQLRDGAVLQNLARTEIGGTPPCSSIRDSAHSAAREAVRARNPTRAPSSVN